MSSVIYTNTASLVAQKNLLGAQNALSTSVERLSSGLRINRARDDAAGLSVANSLQTQINGANQGIRNMNDAISMVQTAEGAIAAASDMGQRILTLATQGANGTLGSTEKEAIINEMKKLLDSINSIGSRTSYAGNDLLKISATFNTEEVFTLAASTTDLTAGQTVIAGGLTYTAPSGGVAGAVVISAFLNYANNPTTATATANNLSGSVAPGYALRNENGVVTFRHTQTGNQSTNLAVTGTGAAGVTGTLVNGTTTADNNSKSDTAFSMQISNSSTDVIRLTKDAFVNIGFGTLTSGSYSGGQSSGLSNKVIASSTGADFWKDIQTAANDYVKSLSTQRSNLGAFQNQMEYTLSNITELSANLSASRSRVIDTDYASETAALTRGQILQQAATAMLAQANQMPNVILTLLK
jgi:flagellin